MQWGLTKQMEIGTDSQKMLKRNLGITNNFILIIISFDFIQVQI